MNRLASGAIRLTGVFAAFFVFLFVMPSCASKGQENIPVTSEDIATQILNEVASQPTLSLTEEQLEKHYAIDSSMLESFCVYTANSDTSAFEIAVFQLKDVEKDVSKLQEAVNKRISSKAESFRALNPSEYTMVSHAKTEVKDNFMLVAVCLNPQKAISIFEKLA